MNVLAVRNLRKAFGGRDVLNGVSLTIARGEVHALLGENGAGKSTLIKILAGAHTADEGAIDVAGRPLRSADPMEARRSGVATIHQELSLVGSMTVADNLFLGQRGASALARVDFDGQRREAARILATIGAPVDPLGLVEDLPVGVQQLVEIAKALRDDAELFVFDEPTSALQETEAERLFAEIDRLARAGKGILFVSHRLDEVERIAHRVTVLRDGVVALSKAAEELDRTALVRAMVGDARERQAMGRAEASVKGRVRLELRGVNVRSETRRGGCDVAGLDLAVCSGEIVGLFGLRGSGASELLSALFGARPGLEGDVRLDGERVSLRSARDAVRHGLSLLPSDRKNGAVFPDLSALANATLASLPRLGKGPFLSAAREERALLKLERPLSLERVAPSAPMETLSGGSQQKIALARCLLADPKVLLLDEPTRGVDVAAKADIHRLLARASERGLAVLFFSSETEELLALADRILVFREGRVVKKIGRDEASREAVLHAASAGLSEAS